MYASAAAKAGADQKAVMTDELCGYVGASNQGLAHANMHSSFNPRARVGRDSAPGAGFFRASFHPRARLIERVAPASFGFGADG
jgi:hypothetical protein